MCTSPGPRGNWCTAGKALRCIRDRYNNQLGATDLSFCLNCPRNSGTSAEGAIDAAYCQCHAGYYHDIRLPSNASDKCIVCPQAVLVPLVKV